MTNIQNAEKALDQIPRVKLVNLDTPIEKCEHIKKEMFPNGPHLYIKRDDFIGYIVGGNKVRKLEYVVPEIIKNECTTVVTVGSVQSNHARITAMVARRYGLKCVLILNGEKPATPRANYYLNTLMDVDIHIVGSREERDLRMEEVSAELEAKGEKVYKVPLGASYDIGSFGFVSAFGEFARQQENLGIQFDAILIGSSSAGTQAGMEVGKRLFQSDIRIQGISPDDPADMIKSRIVNIAAPMCERLNIPNHLDKTEILVDESFIGEGYGIPTVESKNAIKAFVENEGILLDEVYTSKVGAAVIDYCQNGKFRPDDNVLFWHTGGLMALFE